LGSENVLEVNEPVLIVRPDDGPIGPKHVSLYVLLMVITDVLDENINTLYKIWNTSGQIKLSQSEVVVELGLSHTRQEMWFEGVWVQDVEKKKLEERRSYRRLREITNEYLNP